MGGNTDSDEFEEDDAEEIAGDDDLDLDRAIKDMEIAKRRSVKVGEPAWRRLEQRLEQKRTAKLISDVRAASLTYSSRVVDLKGSVESTMAPD